MCSIQDLSPSDSPWYWRRHCGLYRASEITHQFSYSD